MTEEGYRGDRVILLLFLVLALSVVAFFTVFSFYVEEQELRAELLPIVLRNLYLPVMMTSLLVAADAWRHKRTAWWVYAVTAPVPGVNVALAFMWLRKWHKEPVHVLRWTL